MSGNDDILFPRVRDIGSLSGVLSDPQKVTVRKNSGANVGSRTRLNFIEGNGASLTVTDDGTEIDITVTAQAWPVGSVFISVVSTNPNTLLGYGTWTSIGAGRVLVGLDSGDPDFDTVEETGGAKTVQSTGSVAAPTISGSTANESAHTHSVTSNVAVADHAHHTHQVTSNVSLDAHSSISTKDAASGLSTSKLSGPTNHTVTNAAVTSGNEDATQSHNVTNNAVTSGAGSAHNHGAGTLAASAPAFTGNSTSVVQPYLVVYMWKRTA